MKGKITILLILALISSACNLSISEDTTLVVATYSVRSQPIETSIKQRELLDKHHVEIAALQVIDRFTERNPYDMHALFTTEPYAYGHFSQSMKYMNGLYGISTISQYPFLSTYEQALPTSIGELEKEKELLDLLATYSSGVKSSKKRKEQLYEEGLLEPRVYQRVEFEKEGKKIAFYNIHLSFENAKKRKQQLTMLKKTLDNDKCEYKIMSGTFNTDQSTEELNLFKDNYQMANGIDGHWLTTYPLDDEKMRIFSIDNIVCSQNIEIEEVMIVPSNLSNHAPLIAKLRLN